MKKRIVSEKVANRIEPAYMSIAEYGVHAGIGRTSTIKVATEAGAFRRIGRRRLINVEEADNFIESKKDA